MHKNLAHASFGLLGKMEAIKKVVYIAYGRESYVPSLYNANRFEHNLNQMAAGKFDEAIENNQTDNVFAALSNMILGYGAKNIKK